jgi:hypothetical protein
MKPLDYGFEYNQVEQVSTQQVQQLSEENQPQRELVFLE